MGVGPIRSWQVDFEEGLRGMGGSDAVEDSGSGTGSGSSGEGGTAVGRGRRARAAVEVFCAGACYGAMATTYKLSFAAGFSSFQMVGGQAWMGFIMLGLALLVQLASGRRWDHIGGATTAKLVGLGMLTCVTSILYCYAMSVLPVPVALTLLFQFTWIGIVIQVIITRRPPTLAQVVAAVVIIIGTVFSSGVYETGIAGYDPVGIACALLSAVSCASFVALNGMVQPSCSIVQRGFTVSIGTVVMSHAVCPDFIISGVLFAGMAPYALVGGIFGLALPVILFGLGAPYLSAGTSTILSSAELPAGLFVAMIVLGTPIEPLEWLGVALILAGVCIAQVQPRAPSPPSVSASGG